MAEHTPEQPCRFESCRVHLMNDSFRRLQAERLTMLRYLKMLWGNKKPPPSRWIRLTGKTSFCVRGHGPDLEVQSLGPLGDGKWRKPDETFKGPVGDWERAQFNEALEREGTWTATPEPSITAR